MNMAENFMPLYRYIQVGVSPVIYHQCMNLMLKFGSIPEPNFLICGLAFVGVALSIFVLWNAIYFLRDKIYRLQNRVDDVTWERNQYQSMSNGRAPLGERASSNAWIDDDDIDGNGRGGDTLRRLGVID
jgi:hypothetical protein